MRTDYPAAAQEPQLRSLWQLAFGDSAEFVERFFSRAYSPRRCRCVLEDGHVAAALYWFDGAYAGQRLAYLYAVATHPDFRNRGICRGLMTDALQCLKKRGYDGVLLLPQDARLRETYGRMGFRDCCTVSEFSCAAGTAVPVHPVSAAEYARLRREYLPRDGVIQEGANLSYLESYAGLYAGADFLLAAAPGEDCLNGMELLGNTGAAPGIVAALGYDRGCFRAPGNALLSAMFRPLRADVQKPGYFGLVFD